MNDKVSIRIDGRDWDVSEYEMNTIKNIGRHTVPNGNLPNSCNNPLRYFGRIKQAINRMHACNDAVKVLIFPENYDSGKEEKDEYLSWSEFKMEVKE